MKRKIIKIDQEKCNGCGLCVPDCPEGALQVIGGKARLVGDLLCDGLGACLKTCPENAIAVEEREAEAYDERKVLDNIVPQGKDVVQAHLDHLRNHGQTMYLQQAFEYLREGKIAVDFSPETANHPPAARQCPGAQTLSFPWLSDKEGVGREQPSRLTHWPIQLHLISPSAPHFQDSDLLLAADCVAYSLGNFHEHCLKGRTLAIACPKLDSNQEIYLEKLTALIDQARVRSIKVMIMQVPCCRGLLNLVFEAAARARREIPISCAVVGICGEVLSEGPVGEGKLSRGARTP